MSLHLDDPVATVTGVGPRTAADLGRAFGIATVRDLLEHFPRRYDDLGEQVGLDRVVEGEPATLVGTIRGWSSFHSKRGRKTLVLKAQVEHDDGGMFTATFFNQRFRQGQLPAGTRASFAGKVEVFRGEIQIATPRVTVLGQDGGGGPEARLEPVYDAVAAIPSWKLARWVQAALDDLPPLPEHLPAALLADHGLLALDRAVRAIHRPSSKQEAGRARRRLVFDALFCLQVGLQHRRHRLEEATAGVENTPSDGGWAQRLLDVFPFDPTAAQQRAFAEIGADLARARPMHRLLQGDVGAGKTLVAAWTMLCAVDNGRQAAMMVPTEVLAEQHFATLTEVLAPLGVGVLDGLQVELLTSSQPAGTRRRILAELLQGRTDLVVGTHALLEEGVRFRDLGAVVVDEQHRFGVEQRAGLREKRAVGADADPDGPVADSVEASLPDVLVMTATPIPRSLALTLYGDLDLTELDELPAGRTPVVTQLIYPSEAVHRRPRLEEFIRAEAAEGRGTFVVCPLVEPSDEVATPDAVSTHQRLAEEVFGDLRVELVHGRMKSDAKEAAMTAFRKGEAHVLVATTVIEVGIDVPDATIMVIEGANRFGVSQLHQLRGRVGRGGHRSYCVLLPDRDPEGTPDDPSDTDRRLQAVAATTDGFALAEADLDIRGAGDVFGVSQSGANRDLKLLRLRSDRPLIEQSKQDAARLVAADPWLEDRAHAALRGEVLRRFSVGLEDLETAATG